MNNKNIIEYNKLEHEMKWVSRLWVWVWPSLLNPRPIKTAILIKCISTVLTQFHLEDSPARTLLHPMASTYIHFYFRFVREKLSAERTVCARLRNPAVIWKKSNCVCGVQKIAFRMTSPAKIEITLNLLRVKRVFQVVNIWIWRLFRWNCNYVTVN